MLAVGGTAPSITSSPCAGAARRAPAEVAPRCRSRNPGSVTAAVLPIAYPFAGSMRSPPPMSSSAMMASGSSMRVDRRYGPRRSWRASSRTLRRLRSSLGHVTSPGRRAQTAQLTFFYPASPPSNAQAERPTSRRSAPAWCSAIRCQDAAGIRSSEHLPTSSEASSPKLDLDFPATDTSFGRPATRAGSLSDTSRRLHTEGRKCGRQIRHGELPD